MPPFQTPAVLIFFFLISSAFCFGQNQPNQIPDSGKVGIGISNPSKSLEVKGESYFDGSSKVNGNLTTDGKLRVSQDATFFRDIVLSQYTAASSGHDLNLVLSNGVIKPIFTPIPNPDSLWSLSGNIANHTSWLGTKNGYNLNFKTNNQQRMVLTTDGHLGLGITNPTHRLSVAGNTHLNGTLFVNQDISTIGNLKGTGLSFLISGSSGSNHGSSILLNSNLNATNGGALHLMSGAGNNPVVALGHHNGTAFQPAMNISNGQVGIGTDSVPPNFLLAVKGQMIAEEVRVQLHSHWPDYVFEDNYPLKSLSELEAFIAAHHHLPDLPSAATAEAEGVAVSEMNVLLLQKIEELTLYTLQQQKAIEALEAEIKSLK